MAKNVDGEKYFGLDGQLLEIKRQLRQLRGYPYDPNVLGKHLQAAIEGRFSTEPMEPNRVQDSDAIRVNRSRDYAHPRFLRKCVNPDLEKTGPLEYNITEVQQLRYINGARDRLFGGNQMYRFLEDFGLLGNCLSVADLRAIKSKGIDFFQKYFSESRRILGWKSIRKRSFLSGGGLFVPYLWESDNEIYLDWEFIENIIGLPESLVLYFANRL